jgi:putative peptidoglycan lipid II flippase
VLRTAVRCLTAVAVPGIVAAVVVHLTEQLMGTSAPAALVAALLGGAVLASGYLAGARRVRVREVEQLLSPVLRRLTRA